MDAQMIFALIFVSLLVLATATTHDIGKQSKQSVNLDNTEEINGNQIDTTDTTSGTTDISSDILDAKSGNGLIWLTRRRRHDDQERRHKRIISNGKRACSVKRSVLYETTDEFGDAVQIAPFIGDEGYASQQIIYETYCAKDHCNCRGVDTLFYESACETNYQMVYGRIIKAGKQSWGSVKVRASCGCIVRKKKHLPHMLKAIETTY